MKRLFRSILMLLLLVACVGCDQATKRVATQDLRLGPPRSYLADLVRLEYVENSGAFLSLGAGLSDGFRHWFFIGIVGIALLALLVFALLNRQLKTSSNVGLVLIVSGGVGNWIDRVAHGSVVVDFMNVGIGPLRTGVFNVADLLVEAGIIVVVVSMWRQSRAEISQRAPD